MNMCGFRQDSGTPGVISTKSGHPYPLLGVALKSVEYLFKRTHAIAFMNPKS